MTGATGHDAPRLPPRGPGANQLELDLLAASSSPAQELPVDWPAFEEPALISLKGARRLLVFSRVVAFAWAVAVVVGALLTRRDLAADRNPDPVVDVIAKLGIGVVVLISLCGWYWSDRATRNVHRL